MFSIRNCFIVILALLIPAGAFAGQPRCCSCSQQTVVGTYALAYEGTVINSTQGPVPAAGLFLITISREGKVAAHGYMAVGEDITPFGIEGESEISGEMIVNSDCTGTVDWEDGKIDELIILGGGNEISSIMISGGPLGAPIVTGKWKRISRIHDINHPLMGWGSRVIGTYVVQQSGYNFDPDLGFFVPGGWLGNMAIYHDNTIECRGIAMVGGTQMPFTFANGVWGDGELKCTVTGGGDIMAYGVQYAGHVEDWLIVLDGGNELWGIALSEPGGSPVSLMTAKRVSLRPIDLE